MFIRVQLASVDGEIQRGYSDSHHARAKRITDKVGIPCNLVPIQTENVPLKRFNMVRYPCR